MKLFRRLLSLAMTLALLVPLGASAAAPRTYRDVPAGHWAEQVIEKAAQYGLMKGVGSGTFGLGQKLTRAEFVTLLSRMFRWTRSSASQACPDVTADSWYYLPVQQAAAAGLLPTGEPFLPEQPITRAEMARMLVDALGYGQIADQEWPTPFADVSGPGSGCLALAYDIGMVTGVKSLGQLLFKPEDFARREEAAAMLVRVYERYTSGIDWLHGFYAFSSWSQIDLSAAMDAVSVGWARLELSPDAVPCINSTGANGNDWVKPGDYTLATDVFTKNNTPVNLNIFCSDPNVFLTPEARLATIDAILAASVDYAGITMDAEGAGFLSQSVRQPYADFMAQLRAALPEHKTLWVCVPPDTWYKGYDYAALGRVCDKVILMAHDYQWTSVPQDYVGGDNTDTPVTPIIEVYKALRAITDPETGVADPGKVALQVSFASAGVKVDENGLVAEARLYTPGTATLYTRLCQEDTVMGWSDRCLNPWIEYTVDGERYRVWYEDRRSVEAKLQLARLMGVTGVSLWRLGTIPDYPDQGLFFDVWEGVLAHR